jgi:hypothetical protein
MNVEQQDTQSIVVKRLFDEKMYVELPKNTITMPEEMVQKRYPFEKRPQHIYYQRLDALFFTFSLLQKPLRDKQVIEAIYASFQTIETAYPKSILERVNIINTASKRQCGWFAFQSPSLGMARYCMMYVTSINNRFMHGTCSCLLEDKESQKVIKQVPLSIQSIGKEIQNVRAPLHR